MIILVSDEVISPDRKDYFNRRKSQEGIDKSLWALSRTTGGDFGPGTAIAQLLDKRGIMLDGTPSNANGLDGRLGDQSVTGLGGQQHSTIRATRWRAIGFILIRTTQKPGFWTKTLDFSRCIPTRNPVSRFVCVSPAHLKPRSPLNTISRNQFGPWTWAAKFVLLQARGDRPILSKALPKYSQNYLVMIGRKVDVREVIQGLKVKNLDLMRVKEW